VLGGGLVAGAVVLIGGDPGIGKSTLLLQALASLSQRGSVLYVTGEDSAEQVALRAQRLGVSGDGVDLLSEIRLEQIVQALTERLPGVAVIDSIQTLYSGELTAAPGSVSQVRECAAQLTRIAKQTGISLIIIGHVTKDGALAGPRVLEHIVDTVLYFEGDTHTSFRLVRAVKNRFGAVNELGVFAMTDRGLRGVSNPSALFLAGHSREVAGSCVMATQEGTRPLMVEVQALVDTAHVPNPRRLSVGLESSRLAMLLAVLHRHAGIVTFDQDVFVNAVGGVRIMEPAADLAVALAMVSSMRDKPLPPRLFAFGEIGLAGEIRPAPRGQERLREAAKLGFERAIIPRANAPRQAIEGLQVQAVDRVEDILGVLNGGH
jgi:DNA repair protein RadA/Sms